jgi:hypothetical protein
MDKEKKEQNNVSKTTIKKIICAIIIKYHMKKN